MSNDLFVRSFEVSFASYSMNPPLLPAYAQALKDNRVSFNARFAEARRTQPRLDSREFLDTLGTTVAAVVAAVAQARPDRAAGVVSVLYDLALDLHAREFIGPHSRYPFVSLGWRDLLPVLGTPLAESPRAVAGSITNALYNLSVEPAARPQEWLDAMCVLAPLAPGVPALLQAGQVAAWRSGLAHFRRGALALCRQLPPTLVVAALGLPADALPPQSAAPAPQLPAQSPPPAATPPLATATPLPAKDIAPQSPAALNALLDRLDADPWLRPADALAAHPGRALKLVARVGAFRGFGGLFMAPPLISASGEHFIARDGDDRWLLTADVFGVTFHHAGDLPAVTGSGAFQLDRTGRVTLGKLSAVFPELANFTSAAGNDRTLAVTTPLSHSIYLVALA